MTDPPKRHFAKASTMNGKNLATYLNDHLAGSVVALELLAHLDRLRLEPRVKGFLRQLHEDLLEDRRKLEEIMQSLRIRQSWTRKAMAWIAEKATEWKLSLDDSTRGPLHALESIEAVAIGIDSKRALWEVLGSLKMGVLDRDTLQQLTRRAIEQRAAIEQVRLEYASLAFGDLPVSPFSSNNTSTRTLSSTPVA